MADTALQSMLTQIANIYHLVSAEDTDGQIIESYPGTFSPDIANLPVMWFETGGLFQDTKAGIVIEADAVMFCEEAAVREYDRVHIGPRVFYVKGTPSRWVNPWAAVANDPTAHLMMVPLVEHKDDPA